MRRFPRRPAHIGLISLWLVALLSAGAIILRLDHDSEPAERHVSTATPQAYRAMPSVDEDLPAVPAYAIPHVAANVAFDLDDEAPAPRSTAEDTVAAKSPEVPKPAPAASGSVNPPSAPRKDIPYCPPELEALQLCGMAAR